MEYGLILSFVSMLCYCIVNIIGKYASNNMDIERGLVYQYFTVAFCGFVWYMISSKMAPLGFDLVKLSILVGVGLVGYLGIWALFKGLSKLNVGIVLIVSNSFMFLTYLYNSIAFGSTEQLSFYKNIFLILFFVVLSAFMIDKSDTGKIQINKNLFYPIITAVSWSIFYFSMNYIVKKEIFTPVQISFLSQFSIFLFSLIVVGLKYFISGDIKKDIGPFNKNIYFRYLLNGILLYLGTLFLNIAYQHISANIVNVVVLAQILIAPFITYFLFKDKITIKQFILLIISLVLLVGFIFVK